jgi:acetylglutamate synthase
MSVNAQGWDFHRELLNVSLKDTWKWFWNGRTVKERLCR